MAKGAESKNIITNKILEMFEGAFIYDKNIIIPMIENGENIQIKIALTCSKNMVEPGDDNVLPGSGIVKNDALPFPEPVASKAAVKVEVTEDEKANVAALMAQLGI